MRVKVKDINFLPERVILARKKRQGSFLYLTAGLLVVVFMCWAVWFPFRVARDYRDKLAQINKRIVMLEPAKPYYQEQELLQRDLEQKQAAMQDIENRQLKITEVLRGINSILPRDCYVAALTIKAGGDFNIKVVTNSPLETARVLVGLRQLNLFKNVELADSGDIPFAQGPRPVEFKLKFKGAGEKSK